MIGRRRSTRRHYRMNERILSELELALGAAETMAATVAQSSPAISNDLHTWVITRLRGAIADIECAPAPRPRR